MKMPSTQQGFRPKSRTGRGKQVMEDDDDEEDEFIGGLDGADDDGKCAYSLHKFEINIRADDMDDFVVEDDSDVPVKPSKKRKRPTSTTTSRKRSNVSSPTPHDDDDEGEKIWRSQSHQLPNNGNMTQTTLSRFGETLPMPQRPRNLNKNKNKEKAHKSEPEKRYPWLAKHPRHRS